MREESNDSSVEKGNGSKSVSPLHMNQTEVTGTTLFNSEGTIIQPNSGVANFQIETQENGNVMNMPHIVYGIGPSGLYQLPHQVSEDGRLFLINPDVDPKLPAVSAQPEEQYPPTNNNKPPSAKKVHQCFTCGRTLSSPFNLRRHIRTHTGEKPYKCSLCQSPFSERRSLMRHLKVHVSEGKLAPDDPIFSTTYLLPKSTESNPITTTSASSPVTTNVTSENNEFVLPESHTPLSAAYTQTVASHNVGATTVANVHHQQPQLQDQQQQSPVTLIQIKPEDSQFIQCEIPQVDVSMHSQPSIQIPNCGVPTTSLEQCATYVTSPNISDSLPMPTSLTAQVSNVVVSPVIPAEENTRNSAGVTVSSGTSNDYMCTICGVVTKTPEQLSKHATAHSGARPFMCGLCKASFARAFNLKQHMNLHDGVPSYMCGTCLAHFTNADDLKEHLAAVHYGHKPFKCDFCGGTFSRQENLTRHMANNHEVEKVDN